MFMSVIDIWNIRSNFHVQILVIKKKKRKMGLVEEKKKIEIAKGESNAQIQRIKNKKKIFIVNGRVKERKNKIEGK